jgi:hypothetical protein
MELGVEGHDTVTRGLRFYCSNRYSNKGCENKVEIREEIRGQEHYYALLAERLSRTTD